MGRMVTGLVAVGVFVAGGLAVAAPMDQRDADARSLGVVVDVAERQLDIRVDGEIIGTYDVAVGQEGHRTPTGVYDLSRVIWNPSWVPPDSEWAEDAEPKDPGDPDNPMGRVKIYFTDLLYIHGTDETGTLGEPASHGCVRMRNEDAMRLARLVMEHGGAGRSEEWYETVESSPTREYEVEVPDPPTLRVTR